MSMSKDNAGVITSFTRLHIANNPRATDRSAPPYRGTPVYVEIEISVEASQLRGHAEEGGEVAATLAVARDAWIDGGDGLMKAQRLCAQLGNPLTVSVRSTEGRVLTPAAGRREALRYWTDFFNETPGEIEALRARFNGTFRSASGAAKFVIQTDGEYHGLDIHGRTTNPERLLIGERSGSPSQYALTCFPEIAELADLGLTGGGVAGAPDQEAALKGWKAPKPYPADHYTQACDHLKALGIYESKYDGEIFVLGTGMTPAEGYRYGTKWVYPVIPARVLHIIRNLNTEA